jgi:pyridoxal phosphate enzyme (YggS family)
MDVSLASVRDRMEDACRSSGRDPEEVALVVVTKGRTVGEIEALYQAGQRDFGENRAQELAAKAPGLPSDIRWHFVGPLQTNKVKMIRHHVSLLHSLDRLRLARAWAQGSGGAPPALLEFNLGDEPQKHGFDEAEALDAATGALGAGVAVSGVMAIPPHGEEPAPYFERLVEIRDELAAEYPEIAEVSAGMTDDFEKAIAAGATIIRVGRAIFEGGG